MNSPQSAAAETATNYLTMLVRRKGEDDWEVVGEDIAIAPSQHSGIWDRISERIAKLTELYPVEDWMAWTLVTAEQDLWRGVFEAQQYQAAPPSTVRRSQ
jgi:hypothetical protein